MPTRISVNGCLGDESSQISVLDRGFLYGDSVYEVMRTYRGIPWALSEHLERLERSAERLLIPMPLSRGRLEAEINGTLQAAAEAESYIRVIVTRGSGPISLDPNLAIGPCRVVIVTPLKPLPAELYRQGAMVALINAGGRSASAVSAGAKSGNYLPNVIALGRARAAGADEAILVNAEGQVSEGASSNVFVAEGRVLRTPPLSAQILEGITRRKVIELARQAGFEVREEALLPQDLWRATEVFITSTVREVLPIVRIDEHRVGSGQPGPIARQLRRALRQLAGAE